MNHPHLAALAAALDGERGWQESEHRRLVALPLADRVAAGVTWAPLEVAEVEAAGRYTRLVLRGPRGTALHEGIGAGDLVVVASIGAASGVNGLCVGAEGRTAEVRVEGHFPDAHPVTVTRRFDATTFHRFRQALGELDRRPSALRDVILGERAPSSAPDPLPDDPALGRLDPSQRAAARHALGAPELALVHGPPGTGKTELLVAVLRGLVAREERPWALADSNAAVDHLALRASAAGLDVVRVGHPARIGSAAMPLTLDERVRTGALGPAIRTIDKELGRLWSDRDAWAKRKTLLDDRERIVRQARQAILATAQVLASTLGTLARLAPEFGGTTTAVVDEATQAIEPGILAVVPWVERLVLVGDPHQLGPVVTQPGNPLEVSLLSRLLGGGAHAFPMLSVQRRMHRDVQALVDPIYPGLAAHPAVAGHRLAGIAAAEPFDAPVLWVDTAGAGFDEARDPVSQSLYNDGEVAAVAIAVARMREVGVPATEIGVIAPYAAQVARLQAAMPGIEVATVNAFQGREREAIVCSFVRSNEDGELGFVADDRRLVVALTRARRQLVCVGDSATLASHPRFAAVLATVQAQGGWRTVFEAPWDAAVG